MLEKTKSAEHSEEEIAEDLKEEEDTSTDDGQSGKNTEAEEDTSINEAEDDVETLKAKLAKAEEEKENYKNGMLAAKAKKRNLGSEKHEEVELNESVVLGVLEKQAEKKALRNSIDPKNADYIPELVDDTNYNEIISYIPRSMDKSDYNSIIKSLKMAVHMWKDDKGIKNTTKTTTNIPSSKTTNVGDTKTIKKKSGGNFIKKSSSMEDWYK